MAEEKKDNNDKEKGRGFDDNILAVINASNKEKNNLICSPLSILSALTICMVGAKNNTLKQMLNVLYPNVKDIQYTTENAIKFATKAIAISKEYNGKFDGNDNKPIVNLSNKLWIRKGLKILDSYTKNTGVDFIDTFDNSNANQAVQIVNKWFADNTNNMITNMVDESIMKSAELIITNAIYFNGKFVKPFDVKKTQKNVGFYKDKEHSKEISKVEMMQQTSDLMIAEKVFGIWNVVKLEYANCKISLFLVINDYGKGDEPVLTANDLLNKLNDYWQRSECKLFIPKFKYEYQLSLNNILKEMGITDAFNDKLADFSAITGDKDLFISDVIHKAIIEVDEKGTKAAAATVVLLAISSLRPPTPEKRFDYPFTFYIIDEEKGITLFSGKFEGK